jgi:hypothetical protein
VSSRSKLWGGTLVHVDDLPFDPAVVGGRRGMPQVFSQFRRAVEEKGVYRPPLPEPPVLKVR